MDYDYQQARRRRGCIFNIITALARICAFITLLGLALITYVEWLAMYPSNFRVYVAVITIIVAYLELLWVFDKCVTCCICCFRTETCFYWLCCIPIDNWVKTILYLVMAIPLIIPTWILPIVRIDTLFVGGLLVLTGLVYFIKTFKYKTIGADEADEDDNLFGATGTFPRSSISTQTSVMAINNDQLTSATVVEQEIPKKN